MRHLTVTATGRDRPGIVAAVTGALLKAGCNLSDCSMALLGGQFAMILLVQCPEDASVTAIEEALMGPRSDLGLEMIVREVEGKPSTEIDRLFVISVYGADRPGIVHGFAQLLAEREVNITNLLSHAADGIYTIVLEMALPRGVDEAELQSALSSLGASLDVTINFRPVDTSEL